MNNIVKYVIIALAWIIYLFMAMPVNGDSTTIHSSSEHTQAIATEAPTTEAPATEAPATEAPAAEAPAAEAPAAEAPATEAPTTEKAAPENTSITLSSDVVGDYGEAITLNENTDMPTSIIAFKIPGGVYDVSNRATQGTAQITVYSGVEFDGLWEQFVARDCDNPIVLQAGEKKPLTVQEGQFVKLSDGASNIEFLKTGDVETWEERFLRTEHDVIDYVDNTLTFEYEKRISTTMDYNLREPGVYYVYVEILMAEDTPAYLRNSLKTIEERMRQAPYEMNVYLIYSKNKGEGLCSTALGNGFSDYSLVLKGHRYQFNSLDEIPDDLF